MPDCGGKRGERRIGGVPQPVPSSSPDRSGGGDRCRSGHPAAAAANVESFDDYTLAIAHEVELVLEHIEAWEELERACERTHGRVPDLNELARGAREVRAIMRELAP